MAITSSSILCAVAPSLGMGISPIVGLGDPIYARHTVGTAVDVRGHVRTVPAQTPRQEWVEMDGELRPALLLEPARTNLVPSPEGGASSYTFRSAGVVDAGWTSVGLTGGIRIPRTTGTEYAYQIVQLAGSTAYTISVDAEMDDGSEPVVRSTAAAQAESHFTFFCGGGIVSPTRVRRLAGSAVYRISATVTTAATVARQEAGFVRYPDQRPGGLRLTGLQVERAHAETSLIRTAGARLADTLHYTGLPRAQPIAWYLDYIAGQPNNVSSGSAFAMQFGATTAEPGRLYIYQHNQAFLTTTYLDGAGNQVSNSAIVTIHPGDRVQYVGWLLDSGARRSAVQVGSGVISTQSTGVPAGGFAPNWSEQTLHFGSGAGINPCSMSLLRFVMVKLSDLSSPLNSNSNVFAEMVDAADRLRPDGRLYGEV